MPYRADVQFLHFDAESEQSLPPSDVRPDKGVI